MNDTDLDAAALKELVGEYKELIREGEEEERQLGAEIEALLSPLPNLPAIPLLQFYHRIPHNQTYWTNWPSAQNPYINSAYWHRTWLLVLLGLEPAQG